MPTTDESKIILLYQTKKGLNYTVFTLIVNQKKQNAR